jgi:hypothetical protein
MRLVRCLLSELDAAGHTYVLETSLLLQKSSDVITADVELGQHPGIYISLGYQEGILGIGLVGLLTCTWGGWQR